MYFKKENDSVVSGSSIYNAEYELTAESYDTHAYPVDGWYWFDTLDEALSFFAAPSDAVDAWQGRYILASMPPLTEGPLAAHSGTTVLDQLNGFVAANLSPPEYERYKGAKTWRRDDPMVLSMATLLGLNDAMINAWFESARAVQ